MFIVYDFIFFIISLIYLPVYLWEKKFHRGFLARLGFLPKDLTLDHPIWIHAVSLGEALAVRGLAGRLRQAYPDKKLVISTVTSTGNKIAKGIARDGDFVTYLPLDFSFIVNSVIKKVRPALVVIVETEIWPNFISCLYKYDIPVVIVNTRISDKSIKGYTGIKLLIKPVLEKVKMFCAQTESDAERLFSLGVSKNRIRVTGNLKFDIGDSAYLKRDSSGERLKINLGLEEKLFVAGSTHPGEEGIILNAYKDLLNEFPQLKLLIAPRHPERAGEVQRIAQNMGFAAVFISDVGRKPITENQKPVFILDTIGQLMGYYALAEIVFVGGSLVKKGGQNILEPASLGKPVIFGPYMFNFRDISQLFLEQEAGVLIHRKEELRGAIRDLLGNAEKREELGRRSRVLIARNQGATLRSLEYIKTVIEDHVKDHS